MSIASKIIGIVNSVFGFRRVSNTVIVLGSASSGEAIRFGNGTAGSGTDAAALVSGSTNIGTAAFRITRGDGGTSGTGLETSIIFANSQLGLYSGSAYRFNVSNAAGVVQISNDGAYSISSSSNAVSTPDVSLYRLAAGVFGIGSGAASGAMWIQNSGGRSRVSSDVTNTTVTPANITGLSHTLIAGRKYTGRLVLYAAVPTSADGIRIDFDGGTATMTSFVAQGVLSDDTSTRKLARTTALATDITDTDLNGDGLITIELGFVCNAAGTFIPRVAKEADAAGATLTVLANSFLWLEDMP